MKHKILIGSLIVLSLSACKSNPNKAENIDTKMDLAAAKVSGNEKVGVKNDEMIVMDKVQMSEKLRDLQNDVYSLEDKVYGTRKLGSLGLYGDLKSCLRKLASRQFGGTGTLVWTEPLDRVTDKEDELKVGLDEKKELVGVSQEYLKDRIQRFTGYKMILQKRSDEFQDKIEQCKSDLASREMDADQSARVKIEEAPKATTDKTAINNYMCDFVKSGASLQALMLNAFAKGWLSLSDFKMDQNLMGASLKDSKGANKDNALLFNGWKLAFDNGSVTVGQLLNDGKDAHLMAWTYGVKSEVAQAAKCLPHDEGAWNP